MYDFMKESRANWFLKVRVQYTQLSSFSILVRQKASAVKRLTNELTADITRYILQIIPISKTSRHGAQREFGIQILQIPHWGRVFATDVLIGTLQPHDIIHVRLSTTEDKVLEIGGNSGSRKRRRLTAFALKIFIKKKALEAFTVWIVVGKKYKKKCKWPSRKMKI